MGYRGSPTLPEKLGETPVSKQKVKRTENRCKPVGRLLPSGLKTLESVPSSPINK